MKTTTSSHDAAHWMIYGANGYTGALIAEEAVRRGLRPVLAGRDAKKLHTLATRLGCDVRVFTLDNDDEIAEALSGISLMLHCAGPFVRTWEPMLRACLRTSTHYLDINGEVPVLEAIYGFHDAARERAVTVLPGAGFDVVPTDCLAAALHREMPDAQHLRLAFTGKIRQSPGTWKATLEAIPRGGLLRRDGELVPIPHAHFVERIDFDCGSRWCMSIPWGDLSSAWRSTGIPNIEVFGGTGLAAAYGMKAIRGIRHIMKGRVLRTSEAVIHALVRGPSEKQRRNGTYHLLGEVRNGNGTTRRKWMIIPEGYTTTVLTSLALVEHVLAGGVAHGTLTPSQAGGCDLLKEVQGFRLIDLPK
jgi:short subunit dehydrogenase-like uncharacterized protein